MARTKNPLSSLLPSRASPRNHAANPKSYNTTTTTSTTTTNPITGTKKTKRTTKKTGAAAAGQHHHRKATLGDKVSGAMMKLDGKLTRRTGKKAAGTRRMKGTDGKGAHHV